MEADFPNAMEKVYAGGLEGRRVLDCACGSGESLFRAKELGAGECFGFDAREPLIQQARAAARERGLDDVHFEVRELSELSGLGLDRFDVVLFRGIFGGLAAPISGLKVAADLTRELLVVDSATARGLPDGVLQVGSGSPANGEGAGGLSWLPAGPMTMVRILEWAGFGEVRHRSHPSSDPMQQDRIELYASRRSGLLAACDED